MIYTSVFFALFFIILFLIIVIFLGNSLLRSMLENLLGDKKEGFENYKEPNITDLDECRKVDLEFDNKLNCQTASNIPLTPIKNSFFVIVVISVLNTSSLFESFSGPLLTYSFT